MGELSKIEEVLRCIEYEVDPNASPEQIAAARAERDALRERASAAEAELSMARDKRDKACARVADLEEYQDTLVLDWSREKARAERAEARVAELELDLGIKRATLVASVVRPVPPLEDDTPEDPEIAALRARCAELERDLASEQGVHDQARNRIVALEAALREARHRHTEVCGANNMKHGCFCGADEANAKIDCALTGTTTGGGE